MYTLFVIYKDYNFKNEWTTPNLITKNNIQKVDGFHTVSFSGGGGGGRKTHQIVDR